MKLKKLVHGVGNNDADYNVVKHETVNGKRRKIWRCQYYDTWTNMLERCYSAKYQEKEPTYKGCSVSTEWLKFSNFKAWMETQDWEGKQLDKDLLVEGNKVYSAETCVFVPAALNYFLTNCGASRGALPIGVDLYRGRYRARCRNHFTNKREHLGYFNCEQEAHEAWRKRKHELACQWADMQDDPRIAKALIERYSKYKNPPAYNKKA